MNRRKLIQHSIFYRKISMVTSLRLVYIASLRSPYPGPYPGLIAELPHGRDRRYRRIIICGSHVKGVTRVPAIEYQAND